MLKIFLRLTISSLRISPISVLKIRIAHYLADKASKFIFLNEKTVSARALLRKTAGEELSVCANYIFSI